MKINHTSDFPLSMIDNWRCSDHFDIQTVTARPDHCLTFNVTRPDCSADPFICVQRAFRLPYHSLKWLLSTAKRRAVRFKIPLYI